MVPDWSRDACGFTCHQALAETRPRKYEARLNGKDTLSEGTGKRRELGRRGELKGKVRELGGELGSSQAHPGHASIPGGGVFGCRSGVVPDPQLEKAVEGRGRYIGVQEED